MARRAEAMRLENERVSRKAEARIARKRQTGKRDEEDAAPFKPSGSGVILKDTSGTTMGGVILVALLLFAGVWLVMGSESGAVTEDITVEVKREVSSDRGSEPVLAAAPVKDLPVVQVAESSPPVEPSPPPAPVAPPEHQSRWDALLVPMVCQRPGVVPTGVIPGLDVYDVQGSSFKHEVEPVRSVAPAFFQEPAAEETPAAEEEAPAAEEEAPAAEEEAPAAEEEAPAAEEEAPAAEEEEAPAAEEEAPAAEEETPAAEEEAPAAEEEAPAAEEEEEEEEEDGEDEDHYDEKRRRSRKLLGKKQPRAARPAAAAAAAQMPTIQAGAVAGTTTPSMFGSGGSGASFFGSESTEGKVLGALAEVTEFDSSCQFITRECADAAALQLATALRADAAAVTNPNISLEELRRVNEHLQMVHTNSRTMLNGTTLPSLGRRGGLGACALLTEAEFSEGEKRHDSTISRFASVINKHDTSVYCPTNKPYCTFTSLRAPYFEYTVRLDAQSFLDAQEIGTTIHKSLSEDTGLGNGVANWGSAEKPTHAFITALMLFRSGVCARVDAYGQPGVPLNWYRSQGLGHLVVVPGPDPQERELAKTLVQERYVWRLLMHEEKACFFR